MIREYTKLFDSFQEIIQAVVKNSKVSDKVFRDANAKTVIALEKLKFYNIHAVSIYEANYPQQLRQINDCPLVLYYRGKLKNCDLAAVVGSRKISKYGRKITHQVVDWLNEYNYGIVSGLAYGIDTHAHEKAVKNNQYTIAVMPNSLDTIYPADNYYLANEILDKGGCLVSEMIFNINRGKRSFVQRNRIQAALSSIVIPIEMGVKSGTMHTIDFAKRYNKKIGLFKPTSQLENLESYTGINYLIKNPIKNQYVFQTRNEFEQIFNIANIKNTSQLGFDFSK